MTVIEGSLSDIALAPVEGVLFARAVSYRLDGSRVVSTDAAEFPIVAGVLSAEVSPGPTQFTLAIGPVRQTWVSDVPDAATVGLGVLLGDL